MEVGVDAVIVRSSGSSSAISTADDRAQSLLTPSQSFEHQDRTRTDQSRLGQFQCSTTPNPCLHRPLCNMRDVRSSPLPPLVLKLFHCASLANALNAGSTGPSKLQAFNTATGTIEVPGHILTFLGIGAFELVNCTRHTSLMALAAAMFLFLAKAAWGQAFLHPARAGSKTKHAALDCATNPDAICNTLGCLSLSTGQTVLLATQDCLPCQGVNFCFVPDSHAFSGQETTQSLPSRAAQSHVFSSTLFEHLNGESRLVLRGHSQEICDAVNQSYAMFLQPVSGAIPCTAVPQTSLPILVTPLLRECLLLCPTASLLHVPQHRLPCWMGLCLQFQLHAQLANMVKAGPRLPSLLTSNSALPPCDPDTSLEVWGKTNKGNNLCNSVQPSQFEQMEWELGQLRLLLLRQEQLLKAQDAQLSELRSHLHFSELREKAALERATAWERMPADVLVKDGANTVSTSNLRVVQPPTPSPSHKHRLMAYQSTLKVLSRAATVPSNIDVQPEGCPAQADETASSLGASKENPVSSPSSFSAAAPDLPFPLRSWRLRAYQPQEKDRLQAAESKLRRISKAWHAQLIDPNTSELMKDPVIAPDGTTYDFPSIIQWIATSPTDPRTRLPLDAGMLRPNRQAQAFLSLFRLNFPEFQGSAGSKLDVAKAQAPDVRQQLFDAIVTWQERRALEILAGAVDDEALNGMFERKGRRASLLFWAMGCGLPNVAVAIIRRNDFRLLLFPTPLGMTNVQFAAASGYKDVCSELLKRLPLPVALSFTPNDVSLGRSGKRVFIPAKSTAMTIARQLGHTDIWELFNMAISSGGPFVLQ